MIPGRAEESRRLWVLGSKMVSGWCQRRDTTVERIGNCTWEPGGKFATLGD